MTYPEAIAYLDSFVNHEKTPQFDYPQVFKLERVRKLLQALGNPQENFFSILVAGTKGKGSTCAFAHSILHEAGLKAGLYTSPHLRDFRERIRIGHAWIEPEAVAELVEVLRSPVEETNRSSESGPLTFFEIYTALAFLYFARQKVEAAVVEVGMGGRFDATNVLNQAACAVTPISLDHTDHLGSTLEAIASEKAGIIKRGSVVVASPQAPEAHAVLEKTVLENRGVLVQVGKEISFESLGIENGLQRLSVRGLLRSYPGLATPLVGPYQAVNAACAIGLCESLSVGGKRISQDAVERGVRLARWPGRFDIICRNPFVVLDGAQNEASARALREALEAVFPDKKVVLVAGVSQGKDVEGIGRQLLPKCRRVLCTQADNPRAIPPQDLASRLSATAAGASIACSPSVGQAMDEALNSLKSDEILLVTGSLFVVGEALAWFEALCDQGLVVRDC